MNLLFLLFHFINHQIEFTGKSLSELGVFMKLFLCLCLILKVAYAGQAGPGDKFLVKSVDGSDLSLMKSKITKVLPAHRKVASPSFLPSVEERDKVFKESKLFSSIASWDDFDKDSLYLKLSQKGPNAIDGVLKKYPALNRTNLETAQKLILASEAL